FTLHAALPISGPTAGLPVPRAGAIPPRRRATGDAVRGCAARVARPAAASAARTPVAGTGRSGGTADARPGHATILAGALLDGRVAAHAGRALAAAAGART